MNYFLDDRINRAEILFPGVGCFLIAVLLGSWLHKSYSSDNLAKLQDHAKWVWELCNIGHIHCSNVLSKGRASDCIADWVQVCLSFLCGPDMHRLGGVQPDPESLEGAGPGESSFHIPPTLFISQRNWELETSLKQTYWLLFMFLEFGKCSWWGLQCLIKALEYLMIKMTLYLKNH